MEPLITDLISLKDKFGRRFLDKSKRPLKVTRLDSLWFFLLGYLKERVYNPMPKILEDLKENIMREMKKNP